MPISFALLARGAPINDVTRFTPFVKAVASIEKPPWNSWPRNSRFLENEADEPRRAKREDSEDGVENRAKRDMREAIFILFMVEGNFQELIRNACFMYCFSITVFRCVGGS